MCQARSTDMRTDSKPSRSIVCSRRCDARWCVALNSFLSLSIAFNTLILISVAEGTISHDRAESSGSGNTE